MRIKFYHETNGVNLCNEMGSEDSFNRVSNFLKDWINVENFNLLIGSGCSSQAIPLMNKTFKELIELDDSQILNDETYRPFEKYKKKQLEENGTPEGEIDEKFNQTMNIEEYLDWLNQAIQFNEYIDEQKSSEYKKAFDYTTKGLADSMNADINHYLSDENYKKSLETYIKFYQLLFQVRTRSQKIGNVNVFTSNYDLFNEVAFEQMNIHYTTGFKGGVNRKFTPSMFRLRLVDDENRYKEKWDPVRRFVKLYKLHGSLNWIENHDNEIVQKEEVDEENERRMIYPYVSKHNLTRQTPYSELFREFSISMQKSNSVLFVIGYGFPDEHINQIIKQGLDNPDLTIIVFGNIQEDNLKRFRETAGNLPNLHIIGGEDVNDKSNVVGHYFENIIKLLGGDASGL